MLRLPETKNGQPRNLSLCKDVLTLLEKRKACRFTSKYIFANPKTNKPYGCIFHAWDIARTQAGFPQLRIHDLRHSFASALVNQGVSLYEVQYLLGHNSIRSTQRYSHLNNQRLLKSVEHVSKYFSWDTDFHPIVNVRGQWGNKDHPKFIYPHSQFSV